MMKLNVSISVLSVSVSVLSVGLSMSACSSTVQKPTGNDGAGGDTGAVIARKVDCSGACMFTATYTVSTDGFFSSSTDKAVLSAPQAYQHLAYTYADGGGNLGTFMCAPAIAPCTDGGPTSACDIVQDLADPVVEAAFAQSTPPFFGENTHGTDGDSFSFKRDDGHGFEEEDVACVSAGCIPVPAAIARLKSDLQKLDGALILSQECTALNVRLVTAGEGQGR
jgi:hypothetical protein